AAHVLHGADAGRDGAPPPSVVRGRAARGRRAVGRNRLGCGDSRLPLAAARGLSNHDPPSAVLPGMDVDPTIAFATNGHEPPAIEVRVNFGVYAGREATAAEIDRLADWLLDEVGEISIISEDRHEIDAHAEASVHQVR